ncbi:hypothetical protein L1987_18761 [Smallanthus sonchifolius]|uniref:Uncharacterized protein n=1 Tax=Smallanthus sonchifolius TaxID=185202 RepID=A0ACB9J146_9ASTR|nr:hypothetical protein L1987_18761 [Smallanthus sonchifolius]
MQGKCFFGLEKPQTTERVVEFIVNGDSHVPFRDSKLTMLLQDYFEDDKSKILMILCASPDPKELHKTVSTLEYWNKRLFMLLKSYCYW